MRRLNFITPDEGLSVASRGFPPAVSIALILLLVSVFAGGLIVAQSASVPYLEVLGIAQDGGLPHAACNCERCAWARQSAQNRRYIASLALVQPGTGGIYLFDATPDLREQLALLSGIGPPPASQVDREPVAGVFLTHAHIGHYLGLAFFGYEAIHTQGLPVMATPRMAEFLRRNGPWSQLVSLGNITLEEMSPGGRRQVGNEVVVQAIPAPHREEYTDTLGFLIHGPRRSVFYLPDTDSWRAWLTPVTELLRQVDVAIVDGTFFSSEELPGRPVEEIGHPLIQDTMDLLQPLVDKGGLEVYFTHLNHSNAALDPHGEARQSIDQRGFHVLEQGQKIAL